jgi:hypothetical protein
MIHRETLGFSEATSSNIHPDGISAIALNAAGCQEIMPSEISTAQM